MLKNLPKAFTNYTVLYNVYVCIFFLNNEYKDIGDVALASIHKLYINI